MPGYRYSAPPAAAGGTIAWVTPGLDTGTVYGTAAIVTARTPLTITIDPSQAAGRFIDNAAPDNRTDYWWASQAVDLSDWPADSPALLMIDVIRADAAPLMGTILGGCFSNTADPTAVGNHFAGVYTRRKITSGDSDGWHINHWGNLGGFSSTHANRQRVTQILWINASRDEALDWIAWHLQKGGNSGNDRSADLSASSPKPFDITGGLWYSTIAGSYQPDAPPDPPTVHTPIAIRYAVVPFGENPA